ncbi:hypothetical protein SOV_24470 [Sporomusa ovata DSM 2662]|uniref:Putative secreted protein n=1 Tax=Sporomusa ovata TaxID=2378 RepID=A0A0U1L3Q3_9FIRM|nr:DUF2953 domain-containing protein [Sporomusa ovata]EQB25760.1 hypothetical protein DUF2953 [Sporomusa ovata DSM 2662]CQR74322.1 putative secreted protein [Sporomusa ovata]
MNNWLFVLISTAILLVLLFRVNVYMDLRFCRRNDDDYVAVTIYALQKLFIYTMKIPIIKLVQYDDLPWITSEIDAPHGATTTKVSREQRFVRKCIKLLFYNPERLLRLLRTANQLIRGYLRYVNRLSPGIHCEKLELKTIYGFEDAAFTGIMMGILGALTEKMLRSIHNRLVLDAKPCIKIQPVYGHSQLEIELQCIFRIRFGNVITATMANIINSMHREATRSG